MWQDPGEIFSSCGCEKIPTQRWDPHPLCYNHMHHDHFIGVQWDLQHNGPPYCLFCRSMPKELRERWSDEYAAWWKLDQPEATGWHGGPSSILREIGLGPQASYAEASNEDFIPPSGVVGFSQANENADFHAGQDEYTPMSTEGADPDVAIVVDGSELVGAASTSALPSLAINQDGVGAQPTPVAT